MAFKALNVRTHLSLSFVAAIVLTIIACILALFSLYQFRTALEIIVDQQLPILIAAYELAQQSEATIASTPNLALSGMQRQRRTVYYRIHNQLANLSESVARLKDIEALQRTLLLARIAEEHAYLSATFEALNTAAEYGDSNLLAPRSLHISQRIDSLLLLYSQRAGCLVVAVHELIVHSRATISHAGTDSNTLTQLQSIFLIFLSLLCILVTFLTALHVSDSIGHRLLHLYQVVAATTGEEVQFDSGDEIAGIARAIEGLITARQYTEETLRTAKDAADGANMAKTRLLAAASHDLRQPLQALGLFVTALLDLRLAAEPRTIAEKIALSVTTLRELLDALLDISKLDSGGIVPNRSAIPLASLIGRLVPEFEPVATAKHLRFLVGSCRGYVVSDPVLLNQILRNLLANAIRYTTLGGVLIGCRHRRGQLRVEIWDSGPGISSEQKKEIFREFHQANRSTEHAGVGLGLAIVDRTARLLGHRIVVESRLGRGSMFAVEVETAVAPREARAENRILPTTEPPPASSILSGRVVVVIDDDPLIRHGLQLLLKGWGCTVIAAESGDAAVVELSRCEVVPEAIIADYWLSNGETGHRAIATLREAVDMPLPALLMIAGGIATQESLSLHHQAQTHGLPVLRKPVPSEQLLAFLAKALRIKI
ncbi:two-component hybrid sensor and regulator [invertebrate metagenome]|uniref:histidine kinase n=1 Tax=invertebrate metagenome TaxID=1711999 RepID=A0A484H6E5_9ZZZZ